MITETFSHCKGEDLVQKEILESLLKILKETNFEVINGCTLNLRKIILSKLKTVGWSNDFNLDANSQITLTSSLNDHILCFQTGNMSRFYADLLKMQYLYINGKSKVAIYIIPSKTASKIMGSNIANFDRLTFELNLFKDIISIPTLVIGIK